MIRRLAPLGILALVSLGAGILVQGFVQQVLLRPAFYMLWVGELFLRSLPRGVFWGILTLVAAFLVMRSLSLTRSRQTRRSPLTVSSRGPVAQWQHRLQRGQAPGYGQWLLARSLRRLTHTLLDREATLEEEKAGQTEGQLRVVLPQRFAAYFATEVESSPSLWGRYGHWLPNFVLPPARHSSPSVDPHDIVAYLEQETHTRDIEE